MTESIVSSHLRKPRKAITLEQISGVRIPDSKIAREVTQFIRDSESDLLFHHSVRVYFWGALTGNRMGLTFDPELLYTAAMFHDVSLTAAMKTASYASKWMARMPRVIFFGGTASPKAISRRFGMPSLSTQRLAYRNLCVRRSRWCRPGPAWM